VNSGFSEGFMGNITQQHVKRNLDSPSVLHACLRHAVLIVYPCRRFNVCLLCQSSSFDRVLLVRLHACKRCFIDIPGIEQSEGLRIRRIHSFCVTHDRYARVSRNTRNTIRYARLN
jgi:hypothetical protein